MNSTLKPHLLIEVIGLQRECMFPEKLCRLFLAYRNFSEVFAFAFRYRCDVLHDGRLPHFNWLSVITRGGITFSFDREFHIPALLRIAGRLMHVLDGPCRDESWVEPFLEGLDENRSLEHIICGGKRLFQRYAQHHASILKLTLKSFSWLDHLKDVSIGTLFVRFSSSRANTVPCNVTHIDFFNWPTCDNESTASNWSLIKFNKELLKSVTYRGQIDFEDALPMVEAFKSAEEITIRKVQLTSLPRQTYLLDRLLNRLGSDIDKLWSTMLTHPGTVTVNAIFERRMSVRTHDAFMYCKQRLTGYKVTECRKFVQCTHQKRADLKVLNVDLQFKCVTL